MPSTVVIMNSYLPLQAPLPLPSGEKLLKQETIRVIEKSDSESSSPIDSPPLLVDMAPLATESLTSSVLPSTMMEKDVPEVDMTAATIGSKNITTSPIQTKVQAPRKDVPEVDMTTATIGSKNIATGPIQTKLQAPRLRGASKLKRMLDGTNDLIVCPGVYDGVSARVALQVGFDALYMTGAGTTASRLGQPDLGIAQLSDMREHAEMIANLDPWGPPVIADMDTGWGGPIMVANSVSQYIRAGVAGFHIEDQIQNKRCGHLQGKQVVSEEEFYMRIRAAKGAKDRAGSDIVLIARTDANQQLGYDECMKRLKGARNIGADVGLLEGFTSKDQAQRAVKELAPWPLLLNMVENGATPIITTKEAAEMGFRIMIFSFGSLAPAVVAIKKTLEKLKAEGVVGTGKDLTPRALFEICGLKDSMMIDYEAGGIAFAAGV